MTRAFRRTPRTRRQTVGISGLLLVYIVAISLDLTHHGEGGGALLLVAVLAMITVQTIEARRTRGDREHAKRRERHYYAARRAGASGPEGWIASGQDEDDDPDGQPL